MTPWLTVLGVVPLVGALLVSVLPTGKDLLAKQVALATSLVVLVLTVVMCADFDPNGPRFQFAQSYDWIKAFGVHYAGGAEAAASGSQVWNGHSGALIAKAMKNPRNSHLSAPGLSARWVSGPRRNVPWCPPRVLYTYSAMTATSMSSPPSRL